MNEDTPPIVSVLMPVYNAESYIQEAIDSILHQTFTDFELLIINDGSTDQSFEAIQLFDDPRIRTFDNDSNKGLVFTLNRGIELARGEYIARMDQDDIALPDRLESQLAFMELHPSVGLLGTNSTLIDEANVFVRDGKPIYPTEPNYRQPSTMRWNLLWGVGVSHPTVMIRRDILVNHNLRYNPEFEYAEDHDLWTRIAGYTDVTYLPDIKLHYRMNSQGMSRSRAEKQNKLVYQITKRQIKEMDSALGDHPALYALHRLMFRGEVIPEINYLQTADLLRRVYRAFVKMHSIDHQEHRRLKIRALAPIIQLAFAAKKQNLLMYYRLLMYYYRYLPNRLPIHIFKGLKRLANKKVISSPH